MITAKDAIAKIEKANPSNKVIGLAESDDRFMLTLDNDNEGCETVNKQTGEIGFIWVWDYIDLAKSGKVSVLNIDEIKQRAS